MRILRKIFGKGGGTIIGTIIGTLIGTAAGNPVLGARIGATIGGGADTVARNDQIRANRQAAERDLELRQNAEQARLNNMRAQIRQTVQAARLELQNNENALTQYEQEQRAYIRVAQSQIDQRINEIRSQINIDQETLAKAKLTWQQMIRNHQDALDKQINLILCITECCYSGQLEAIVEHVAALDTQMLQLIADELLQICHTDDVDTISWIITSKFKKSKDEQQLKIREQQSQALQFAVRVRDDRGVLATIKKGADVNAVLMDDSPFKGYRTIHFAACFGQLISLKKLLVEGADIAAVNLSKQNILFLVAWNCYRPFCREMLNYLLTNYPKEMRKQLLATSEEDGTPLHAIVMSAYQDINAAIETAKILIRFGADVTLKNKYGASAQELAILFRHPELAQAIQEEGEKQAAIDERLCMAACNNNETELLEALEVGANVNARGQAPMFSRFPALLIAAHWGSLKAFKILMQKGADLEEKNRSNQNLLFLTVWNCHTQGNQEVLKYLMTTYPREMRKQLLDKNDDQQTPLHAVSVNAYVALQPCINTALKLIQWGVDVTQNDTQGRTAEALAIECQQLQLAQTIREFGAKQILVDERLCNAVGHDDEQELLEALEVGANVNAKGQAPMFSRFQALLIAAHWGNLKAFKILMQKGADLEVKNNNNQNVLFLTVWNCQTPGCRQVLDYLLKTYPEQMRKQLLAKDDNGYTPLHATTVNAYVDRQGLEATAIKLINFGAKEDLVDNNGLTASKLALEKKQYELAMLINKYGMRKKRQETTTFFQSKRQAFFFKRSPDSLLSLCLNIFNTHPKLTHSRKQVLDKTRYFPSNLISLLKPVNELNETQHLNIENKMQFTNRA